MQIALLVIVLCCGASLHAQVWTLHQLETHMNDVPPQAKFAHYSASTDFKNALGILWPSSDRPSLYYVDCDRSLKLLVNLADDEARTWLDEQTGSFDKDDADLKRQAAAGSSLAMRLDDARERLSALVLQLPVGARWFAVCCAADEPTFHAIIGYDPVTGRGLVSLNGGAAPRQLRLQSDKYESDLVETLRSEVREGTYVVGERGVLVVLENGDLLVRLTGDWSKLQGALEGVDDGPFRRCDGKRIRSFLKRETRHVLSDSDAAPPAGEFDAILDRLVMLDREYSPIDPLVFLIKP